MWFGGSSGGVTLGGFLNVFELLQPTDDKRKIMIPRIKNSFVIVDFNMIISSYYDPNVCSNCPTQ